MLFTLMSATAGYRGLRRQESVPVAPKIASSTGTREEKIRYTMAYDAGCGPCAKFRRVIELLDTHGAIDFVSLLEANEMGLLDAIPERLRFRSFHLISPAGSLDSGADALPGLIRLLPTGWLTSEFIFSTPGIRRLVTFAYSSLSRMHERSSCGPEETSSTGGRRVL